MVTWFNVLISHAGWWGSRIQNTQAKLGYFRLSFASSVASNFWMKTIYILYYIYHLNKGAD
jgi:hypothetical protein